MPIATEVDHSPRNHRGLFRLASWGLILCTLTMSSGCIGLAANLLHAIHGNNRPAEFRGLENKRVAVIVATESGIGSNQAAKTLMTFIQTALSTNMKKKVEIVRSQEVDKWLDQNGWTEADPVEIGRGVNADMVLMVDLLNLQLNDGPTLYRGQSDINVSVYDVKDMGKLAYRKQISEFSFPTMGGTPVSDTSESKFRAAYLGIVANKVSSLFYQIEATSDFALDATSSRF